MKNKLELIIARVGDATDAVFRSAVRGLMSIFGCSSATVAQGALEASFVLFVLHGVTDYLRSGRDIWWWLGSGLWLIPYLVTVPILWRTAAEDDEAGTVLPRWVPLVHSFYGSFRWCLVVQASCLLLPHRHGIPATEMLWLGAFTLFVLAFAALLMRRPPPGRSVFARARAALRLRNLGWA